MPLGLLSIILKPIASFAFGTPARSKITIVVFLVLLFGGITSYFTYKYESIHSANQMLETVNKEFKDKEVELYNAIEANGAEILKQREAYVKAIDDQRNLQVKFSRLEEEKTNALNVFTKEQDRYERLLQKNGSRIVRLSNIKSKRMRDKWVREASKINNALQKGASGLLTSPGNADDEPK